MNRYDPSPTRAHAVDDAAHRRFTESAPTVPAPPGTPAADDAGHQYATESAHTTSEGRIAYQRCSCGQWRVQRYPRVGLGGDQSVTEAVVWAGPALAAQWRAAQWRAAPAGPAADADPAAAMLAVTRR